ncbi:MAG: dihydropteroate synthase [Chthonomonas sp.]|nr:dihydropteroate synthase [Chthonomonas sp.]
MSNQFAAKILGIVNVTPDSFSDGGKSFGIDQAVEAAQQLRAEGADYIDIGGESTRPGAEPVELEEEWKRVEPVITRLIELGIPVSLDTRKAEIARRGIVLGVQMVNDVSGGDDPRMVDIIAASEVKYCLMHHQGDPQTMQMSPAYTEVVTDVRSWLSDRAEELVAAGVNRDHLIVDPGFGFGKTTEHNLQLLQELRQFRRLRLPIMVGLSRKSFIGRYLGNEETPADINDRLPATLVAQLYAVTWGAEYVRTHDVRATVASLRMAAELERG